MYGTQLVHMDQCLDCYCYYTTTIYEYNDEDLHPSRQLTLIKGIGDQPQHLD